MPFIRSAYDAELNAMEQMRRLGHLDAEVSPVGPDGGIDVRSSSAIAQVKWRGGQTSRAEVQNLFGARANNHHLDMLFFSAAGYSKKAIEYADEVSILLFTYDPDGEICPVNPVAAERIKKGPEPAISQPHPRKRARERSDDEVAAEMRLAREEGEALWREGQTRVDHFYQDVPSLFRRPDAPDWEPPASVAERRGFSRRGRENPTNRS